MEQTIRIFEAFKNNNTSNLKLLPEVYSRAFGYWTKPPLFFLTAAPFLLFGINKDIMVMSNMVYLAILLFATYGIGRIFFNSRIVGLSAAFLVSMFPGIFAFSRVFLPDIALASMVTLTFYLITLNKFGSFKFSLLFGLIVGLGALTKQTYFAFLLPALICFFLKKDNLRDKRVLMNFIFSIILGLIIAAGFYVPQFYATADYYFFNIFQVEFNSRPFYYLYALFSKQLLPVFFCLFIISSVFLLIKKKYPLLIMIIAPLIICSLASNKLPRHTLSILPYIAVSICGFVWSLSAERKTVLISLILFSLLQYFILSYQNKIALFRMFSKRFLFDLKGSWIEECGFIDMKDEGDWEGPASEIISIVNDRIKKKTDTDIQMLFIKTGEDKILAAVKYLSLIKRLPINFKRTEIDRIFFRRPHIEKDFENQVIQSDFIIKEEILPEQMPIHAEKILTAFKKNHNKFYFIKTVIFPDGSRCQVYKNKDL